MLSVEAKGFKKYSQTDIPLAVQQQATFDVSLEVGDISTTVEVTSQAPLLNTTIATLGQVIENRYMVSLPNIGRNPLFLLSMTPGVVGVNSQTNTPTNTNFVANGARNSTSDVLVDGAIVNTTEQNTGRDGPEVYAVGGRGSGVQDAGELLRGRVCRSRAGRS